MKKYVIRFVLLFAVTTVICTAVGYLITRQQIRPEEAIPNATIETETVTDGVVAMSEAAEPVINKETINQYYLVNEDGFLLVFCKDKTTICLYTHVPVTDFPEKERSKLMEGIWFTSMLDIFNYLESYTS